MSRQLLSGQFLAGLGEKVRRRVTEEQRGPNSHSSQHLTLTKGISRGPPESKAVPQGAMWGDGGVQSPSTAV